MRRARRPALALLATVLAAGVVLTPTRPALAKTNAAIQLKPGQTFERDYPALPPVTYPLDFFVGVTPPDCEDDGLFAAVCDVVHIKLDLPAKDFTDRYTFNSLNFTLDWPGENIILPAVGSLAPAAYGITVWDDPIVEDADEDTECDSEDPVINYYMCFVLGPSGGGEPGGDEPYFPDGGVGLPYFVTSPINTGLVPKKASYAVIIFNYFGVPAPYHIKAGFTSIKSDKIIDLSVDELIDLSAPTGGGALSGFTSAPVGVPSLSAGNDNALFGTLGNPVRDADLDAAALNDDIPGLDQSAADIIRGRNVRLLRPKGDEKPLLVVLWLVLLPLAAAGATAWWFLRRRASLFS